MTNTTLTNILNTESDVRFIISQTTEISLKHKFVAFHGILPRSHLKGDYLEDAVASSLDTDPNLHNYVEWKSNSHNPYADIILANKNNFGISVKSGTIEKDILKISGHRLGKVGGDFNKINKLLTDYRSDVTLCFVYKNFRYALYYVDKEVFSYPASSLDWKPKMGERTGKVSEYIYESTNELRVKILPGLSWQVWWEIPINLCRLGIFIDIPRYVERSCEQQNLTIKPNNINNDNSI